MTQPPRAARQARAAVASLFFANGALYANVVPRYPDIKAGLELSNAALGSALAATGLGALILGFLGGALVHRWGSARVAPSSTIMMALNLMLLGLVPSWLTLVVVLFIAGSLDAIADLSDNAHALRVERVYGRSILNSLHGMWSIGAVAGGLMGAAAAGLAVPVLWHLAIAGTVFIALALAMSRLMLPGHDDTERTGSPGGLAGLPRLGRLHLARTVVILGAVAAMAQIMEDTAATWGTVYLREELGAAAAIAGLGFVALQALQIVGRLSGDRMVTRYGDRAVGRAGAAMAGVAMLVALAAPGVATTVVAFGAVGLGIGTLIPAAMRSADSIPGLPRGVGLTLVGSVDRIAILTAPPIIGLVADAASLRVALLVLPLAAAILLVLVAALPRRHEASGGRDLNRR